MSFNSFFGFKENFVNADKVTSGAEPDSIDFDSVKIAPPDDELPTGFELNEALHVEYKESNKEECNNIIDDEIIDPILRKPNENYDSNISMHLNKYQQIEILYRFVKACDKYRNYRYCRWVDFDYSPNLFIPPLKKLSLEEVIKSGKDCNKKSNWYEINPEHDPEDRNNKCWTWLKSYHNGGKMPDWYYDRYDAYFGIKPRKFKWWHKDGLIGFWRQHLKQHQNVTKRRIDNGEVTTKWLLQRCPILKTLVYKNNSGQRFWKIKIGNELADYTPLFNKLKNGGYINCSEIISLDSEESKGEFFRGAYFFTPIMTNIEEKDKNEYLTEGSTAKIKSWEFNEFALNSWNQIDMDKVDDLYAKTPKNYREINSENQIGGDGNNNPITGTGWGNCLCDIFDRLIRNDLENIKSISEESPMSEFSSIINNDGISEDDSENSQGKDVVSCEIIEPGEPSDYYYNEPYSWCNESKGENYRGKYLKYIKKCKKACAIYDAIYKEKVQLKNVRENQPYFYTVRNFENNNDWRYTEGSDTPVNKYDLHDAMKVNQYIKNEEDYNCVIDTTHDTTNNQKIIDCIENCEKNDNCSCIFEGFEGSRVIRNDNNKCKNGLCEAFTNKQSSVIEGFSEGCLESLDDPYSFTGDTNASNLQNNIRKKVCRLRTNRREIFTISEMIEYIWLKYNGDVNFENNFNLENIEEYFNSDNENIFKVCYEIIKPIQKEYPKVTTNIQELIVKEFQIIGRKKRTALQIKLSFLKEFEGDDFNTIEQFYTQINTLKKFIYSYIYVLKFGVENTNITDKINDFDKMIEKIKNNKDQDLTNGDYINIINYLNAIKKENKSIHYKAQIRNISTINLSNYYKLILWFVGFVALSAIIYKKIKK